MEEELQWLASNNLRELLKEANKMGITKEQIVSLLYNDQYLLIYYGKA